jgi:hypothetical protein
MCEFAITRWRFAQIDYVNGLAEIFMDLWDMSRFKMKFSHAKPE